MIFNLIVFVLFVVVAYFHYLQGLFSATISAICCILAAVLALGYHELLASYLVAKVPDQANAIALVGIFILAYVLMRILFDKLVPGNVRYPFLMDKIGSAVAGVFAALFSTGIFAIAAQSLPFGTTIGGFARQEIGMDRSVEVGGDEAGVGRGVDAVVTEEVLGDRLGDPARASSLWFNEDSSVIGLTRGLSDAGSVFDNGHPLEDVHPDYLTEQFGQRLGVPIGAKHVISGGVGIASAWTIAKLDPTHVIDAEISNVRGDQPLPELNRPEGPSTILVVGVNFGTDSGDSDGFMRVSPAGVRLKAGNNDYYPIGTLVGARTLLKNRMDDPLIISAKDNPVVNFVFVILNDDLNSKTEGQTKTLRFKDGTFLEVKRGAVSDLSGRDITDKPSDTSVNLKDFQNTSVLSGVVRKHTTRLMKLIGMTQQNSTADTTPPQRTDNSQGHQPDNELDPTRIPIHQMGF